MWMEERIGKRVNVERTDEALGTGAEIIATSCPYCLIMLDDAVSAKRADGGAEGVKVIDIAQVIADSIGLRKTPAMAGGPAEAEGTATEPVEAHQPDSATATGDVEPASAPSAPETEAQTESETETGSNREPVTDPSPGPTATSEALDSSQAASPDTPTSAEAQADNTAPEPDTGG
jgi:hypothetical protein